MAGTKTLSAPEVLDAVRQARADKQAAEIRELQRTVDWAMLHPCPDDEWPAHWGQVPADGEHVCTLAGPGAPLVSELAVAGLGAALHITLDAARQLLADALELAYRLPRLWEHVVAGRVPAWLARQISRHTHDLSEEAVAFADRLIASTPAKVHLVDAEQLVNEARLYFDPDRAAEEEQHRRQARGVHLQRTGRTSPGTTDVAMTLDTPDALLFDQTLSRIAGELKNLGDLDPLDVRRARAVGILADPQYALDLLAGRDAAPSQGGTGNLDLYVHLTPADLLAGGACSVEQRGAATTRLLEEWLARHADTGGKVVLRPVIDLDAGNDDPAARPIDAHDPPAAMRELCFLRDAHCVFPGCRRDSRRCDLDHVTAYLSMDDGGPPGQTHPGNLAPLCRSHHRLKTFTSWDYKRLDDGSYTWTAPTGHQYVVRPVSRRPPGASPS